MQARHAALGGMRSARSGPVQRQVTRPGGRAPAGAQAADSEFVCPPGHHLRSGADVIRHQHRGWKSRQETTSRRRRSARTDRIRSHRTLMGARPTGDPDRRGALLATAVSRPSLSVHVVAAARLALIATHDACARLAACMGGWKGAGRRRSRWIPTPALVWSRPEPREPVPGSPLPVRTVERGGRPRRCGYASAGLGRPWAPCGATGTGSRPGCTPVCAPTRPRRRCAAQRSHSGTVTPRCQLVLPILVQSGIVAP